MKPKTFKEEIADTIVGYFSRLDTDSQIILLERLKEVNNTRLNQDIQSGNNELDISL